MSSHNFDDEKHVRKGSLQEGVSHGMGLIQSTLDSPMVEHLETQLHYRFADKWVTGEWFLLSEAELKKVEKEAQKIIQEQTEIYGRIEESYELSSKESRSEETLFCPSNSNSFSASAL